MRHRPDKTPRADATVLPFRRRASRAPARDPELPKTVAERLHTVRAQLQHGAYDVDFARLAHRLVQSAEVPSSTRR